MSRKFFRLVSNTNLSRKKNINWLRGGAKSLKAEKYLPGVVNLGPTETYVSRNDTAASSISWVFIVAPCLASSHRSHGPLQFLSDPSHFYIDTHFIPTCGFMPLIIYNIINIPPEFSAIVYPHVSSE